jgi:uncharacterized membrane protein YqaE (UPF0057 family)
MLGNGPLEPKVVIHICLTLFGSYAPEIARIYGVFAKVVIV